MGLEITYVCYGCFSVLLIPIPRRELQPCQPHVSVTLSVDFCKFRNHPLAVNMYPAGSMNATD